MNIKRSGFHPAAHTLTQTQLLNGAILATSVKNVPNNGIVTFTISIPLKTDTTATANGSTKFQDNLTNLSVCEDKSKSGFPHTTTALGIPNAASLAGEDLTYNAVALEDNVACIPVTPPAATWKVEKAAPDGAGGYVEAGTTGPEIQVAPDGTVTVTYRVRVTNSGGSAGTHPVIMDTPSVPSGFGLTGVTLGSTPVMLTNGSFTIPAGTTSLAPGDHVDYLVTVTANAPNVNAVNWTKAGACNTEFGGTPADGGFFNFVTMEDDTDGVDNNDACVPVAPPPSTFKVQKSAAGGVPGGTGSAVTVGPDGKAAVTYTVVVTNNGPTPAMHPAIGDAITPPPGFTITGVKLGTTDLTPPFGSFTIPAGTTNLAAGTTASYTITVDLEAGDLATTKWELAGECNTSGGGTPGTGVFNKVTMAGDSDGDDNNDACVPLKPIKMHVVKTATESTEGNAHVGVTVIPNEDGTFSAKYTITVTNTSGFTANSDAITDTFTVPAGLVWDGAKTATVAFDAKNTGATAAGMPTTLTQAQLAAGATLATSVQNLPDRQPVTFSLEIPLKLDTTVASGQTQSNYELNVTKLATCSDLTSSQNSKYTNAATGIPNVVSLVGEDLTYTDIPIEDNVACIPVVGPKFKVEKAAPASYNADGTVATWADAGTTGAMIHLESGYTATIYYQVRVTNSGDITASHPAIIDTPTLPAGFVLAPTNTIAVNGVTRTLTNGSYTIPAGSTPMAKGEVTVYTVAMNVRMNVAPHTVDWATLGTCNTEGAGTPADGGFFNLVTMAGDSDGADNNDACVPVEAWRVQKRVENGRNANGVVTGYAPAGQTGPAVNVAPDGTVTVQYVVSVVRLAGQTVPPAVHPAVTDSVTVPPGFEITEVIAKTTPTHGAVPVSTDVTIDNTVSPSVATFTIPAGASALASNGVVDYEVVVKAGILDRTLVNWDLAGVCNTEGAGVPTAGGFFNFVDMPYDTDGPTNNDACVPVNPPQNDIKLVKVNQAGDRLAGAQFTLYGPTDQLVVHSTVTIPGSGEIAFENLVNGQYWLEETLAPPGYARDTKVYSFTVSTGGAISGITPADGSLGLEGIELHFTNLKLPEYPSTGGPGTLPFAIVGLALMGWGALRLQRKGAYMS